MRTRSWTSTAKPSRTERGSAEASLPVRPDSSSNIVTADKNSRGPSFSTRRTNNLEERMKSLVRPPPHTLFYERRT